MFDELKKYKKGSFSFKMNESLKEVCTAPESASGVYIVFASENQEKPIYIGCSGKMQKNGLIKHRSDGIYGRICNGKQFGERRNLSWPKKMKKQQIEELDIHWYITFNDKVTDIPAYVEAVLIQEYFNKFRRLPDWNEAF
jgi:hypothetical protein